MNRVLGTIMMSICLPTMSYGLPENIHCKLYGPYGSTGMSSKVIGGKTSLYFRQPVGFAPASSVFELMYSSGIDTHKPLVIVGKYVSPVDGNEQFVEFTLDMVRNRENARYGKVRAGDFMSNWFSTSGKYKTYDTQCFYF